MPTPSKPLYLVEGHITKEQIKQRAEAETSTLTGITMQPGKQLDVGGKKEFVRIKNLLAIIGKDDALYEGSINRYCQLKSECKKFETEKKRQQRNLAETQRQYKNHLIEFLEYMALEQKLIGNILSLDKQIQAKRKMMLDIEKEDIMTIASALRSIPKKVEIKEAPVGVGAFKRRVEH